MKHKALKFLRTVRLDISDEKAFPLVAQADEWAVTGTFVFADAEPEKLSKKEQLAFRNGWLGSDSFGWATFVTIEEISNEQYQFVASRMAEYIFKYYRAPNKVVALEAAQKELEFASGLCEHPSGTMLSIERSFSNTGISERFKTVQNQDEGTHAKIWSIVED